MKTKPLRHHATRHRGLMVVSWAFSLPASHHLLIDSYVHRDLLDVGNSVPSNSRVFCVHNNKRRDGKQKKKIKEKKREGRDRMTAGTRYSLPPLPLVPQIPQIQLRRQTALKDPQLFMPCHMRSRQ